MLLARLPMISAITLGLLVAVLVSWQAYNFYHQEIASANIKQKQAHQPQREIKQRAKQVNRNIASYKLFGDALAKPKITQPVTKNLPKTKLKLTLTGVMTSAVQDEASALIQGPDKQTLYYKVNDELPGGAILKQVHEDRVVVERAGKLENLIFIEKRTIGIEAYSDYRDSEEADAETRPNTNTPKPAKKKTNPARTQGIKERLNKLRQKMLKNRPTT